MPEQSGTANITVTVIDGGPDDDPNTNDGNGSFSRVFTVTVRAVEDPPRLAAGQAFRLDEQSAKDTLVGTILATDSDVGDSISYTITAGNIANAFAIDAATGTLRVATPAALDFETTPQFNLTVQAEDRTGRRDTAPVRIDLNNVNDAPVARPR